MRSRLIKLQLKTGETVNVLPTEVEGLRKAGLLMEEETQDKLIEQNEPEREDPPEEETRELEQKGKSGYKLPALTRKERRQRIRQAKKLVKAGYSIREVGRKLGVSHTSILRWKRKGWNLMERYGTF